MKVSLACYVFHDVAWHCMVFHGIAWYQLYEGVPRLLRLNLNVSYVSAVSEASYVSLSQTLNVLGSCSSYQSVLPRGLCQQFKTI